MLCYVIPIGSYVSAPRPGRKADELYASGLFQGAPSPQAGLPIRLREEISQAFCPEVRLQSREPAKIQTFDGSLMMLAIRSYVPSLLEQPRRSKMRRLPEWEFLCSTWGALETITASCMFGSIHKKEFIFFTSGIDTSLLRRTCDGRHQHVQIAG